MNFFKKILYLIVFVTISVYAQTDSIAVDLGKEGLFIFISTQALSAETPDENGAVKAQILRRETSSDDFEQIGTVQMAGSIEVFFEAMGTEIADTINNLDSIWTTLKQNPMIEDYGFNAINPNFLIAMGAGYYDIEVENNSEYQYKVEYLDDQNSIVKEAYSNFISPSEKPVLSKPKFEKIIKSDSSAIITWKAEKQSNEESFFTDLFYQVNGEDGFNVIENITIKRESEEDYVYQTVISPLEKGNYYKVYIKPKNFLNRYGPSSDTTQFFFIDYNKLQLMGEAFAKDSTAGIYLSWEKIEQKPYYSGIKIERSIDLTKGYNVLDTVAVNQTNYYDTKVEDKQTYFYRLTPLLSEDVDLLFQTSASATYNADVKNLIPPYNLTVSKKGNIVNLSWKSENDPFGFNVYRSVSFQEEGKIVVPNLKESSYIDSIDNLTQGRDYVYYVTSINEDNIESPFSNKVSIKIEDNSPPPIINGLNGYAEDYRIRLTWENLYEKYNQLAGFNIYRKSSTDKKVIKLNEELIKPNYFDDESIEQGRTYNYYVTAVNHNNLESEYSNESKFTTKKPLLAAPRNIKLRSTSKGIELSWSTNLDERVIEYKIYRESNTDKNRIEIGTVKASNNSFVDVNVIKGELFHYSVKAVSENAESDFSPVGSERYLY